MSSVLLRYLVLAVMLSVRILGAQARTVAPVAEAIRLRDAGDLAGAAAILSRHVERQPADGRAARLLAQTRYWLGDREAARQGYEAALARFPADTDLRLEYARMLVETGARARAGEVLAPLIAQGHPARARALALLGTAAYWAGDLDAARTGLRAAVAADASLAEAREQLVAIDAAAVPWASVRFSATHDNQPMDVRRLALAVGAFATPLTPVVMRAAVDAHEAGRVGARTTTASLEVARYLASARLEIGAMAGAVRLDDAGDWIGRASLGVRASPSVAFRARAERDAYRYTVASLRAPVMTRTATLLTALDHPRGWLGEAAVQQQRFADDNSVTTTYGWLLAPVVRGPPGRVRAGYGIAAQDSRTSRYVSQGAAAGTYVPYYTPLASIVQSALLAVEGRVAPRAVLRADGSLGVHARDDAPIGGPGAAAGATYRRAFSPWSARAALELAATPRFRVTLEGDAGRTAFYARSTLGVEGRYAFR